MQVLQYLTFLFRCVRITKWETVFQTARISRGRGGRGRRWCWTSAVTSTRSCGGCWPGTPGPGWGCSPPPPLHIRWHVDQIMGRNTQRSFVDTESLRCIFARGKRVLFWPAPENIQLYPELLSDGQAARHWGVVCDGLLPGSGLLDDWRYLPRGERRQCRYVE